MKRVLRKIVLTNGRNTNADTYFRCRCGHVRGAETIIMFFFLELFGDQGEWLLHKVKCGSILPKGCRLSCTKPTNAFT